MPADQPPSLPWWARARVRLGLLGLALAGVTALGVAHLTSAAPAGGGCWVDEGPPAIHLLAGEVAAALPRLGLLRVPDVHSSVRGGLVAASSAFDHSGPQSVELNRSPETPVVAGYQVRWWAPESSASRAATAFRFGDPEEAARFVVATTSTHCRPGSVGWRVRSGPPGARGLTSHDHSSVRSDVFFARGPTVFWVDELPQAHAGTSTAGPAAQAEISATGELACRLPAAGCRRHSGILAGGRSA